MDNVTNSESQKEIDKLVSENVKLKKNIKVLENEIFDLKKFKMLADHSYDFISEMDINFKFLYANETLLRFLRHSSSELLGKEPLDFLTIHPDDINAVQTFFKNLFVEKKHQLTSFRVKDKNDNWRWLESIGNTYIAHDSSTKAVVVSRDITEWKKAEDELKINESSYRGLFNSVTEAIYIQDVKGLFLDVNNGAIEMYGYNKNEFLGKTPEFLSAPGKNDLSATLEYVKKAFEGLTQKFEFWGKRKNGEIFPKEVILNKGIYHGQDVIIATARDISDRKNAEMQLEIYTKELTELNSSKDKFFSIIAHDIRGPFNGLLGFSTVLAEEFDTLSKEELKEYIDYVHTSSKTIYNLVDNLLQWSRIQTGKMEFQPIKIDIFEEVYKIKELFNSFSISKRIPIITDIPMNTFAYADQNMLHSILQNLVSNALKFTKPGGKIHVHACKKNENFEISVIDNGVGIKEEVLKNIFRIDSQYTTAGTLEEEGTGLGLILTKELIDKNKGDIYVKSEPGKGSTFIFTIPIWRKEINE